MHGIVHPNSGIDPSSNHRQCRLQSSDPFKYYCFISSPKVNGGHVFSITGQWVVLYESPIFANKRELALEVISRKTQLPECTI
jgi:hypothetical protein